MRLTKVILIGMSMCLAQTAAAKELCGVVYKNWQDLFRQIETNPKLEPMRATPGFRAFSEKNREKARIWALTDPDMFAHPAVACSSVVGQEGALQISTEGVCFSSKENCDRLAEGFKRMN